MKYKLGLRPRRFHVNTLCLHDYIDDDLLIDPGPQDWTPAVTKVVGANWGMDGNDAVGDCACAMESHREMVDSANTGTIVIPTTAQTLALYTAVTGYDPSQTQPDGSNPTDNGTCLTDLFAYLQKTGKILAWAEFDPIQFVRYRQAVNIFGSALVGVNIRQIDMDNFNKGLPWTPGRGPIEGGHAIISPKVEENTITYVTWGALEPATQAWAVKETTEAYVAISNDWIIAASQKTPSGFNLVQLKNDIISIKNKHK